MLIDFVPATHSVERYYNFMKAKNVCNMQKEIPDKSEIHFIPINKILVDSLTGFIAVPLGRQRNNHNLAHSTVVIQLVISTVTNIFTKFINSLLTISNDKSV